MSKNRRAWIREQLGGECKRCGSNIALEIDHIFPIQTSDKTARERDLNHPNLDNMQLLCYVCHKAKTIQDARLRAR